MRTTIMAPNDGRICIRSVAYEAARDRLSREISAVQRITETEAVKESESALAKGPRRGKAADGEEPLLDDDGGLTGIARRHTFPADASEAALSFDFR